MLLGLSFALSAPVGCVALTLIAGTTAIMKIHPSEALATLQHFQPLMAQSAKGCEISRTARCT
jgi:hypothetical protein